MKPTFAIPFEDDVNLQQVLRENPSWLDEAVPDKEAARLRGKTTTALAIERTRGLGPDYIKDGRTVRYTRRAIFEYLAAHQVRVSL
jgi:hypothetical protein